MPVLENFGSDKNLEVDGNWVEVSGNVWLRIARFDNPKYLSKLRGYLRPHVTEIRNQSIDPLVVLDMQKKAMASTILLGWRGLRDVDGNELVYSEQMAYDCLNDNIDFYQLVFSLANDRTNFQQKQEAAALGN